MELGRSGALMGSALNELQRELAALRPFVPEARWESVAGIVRWLRLIDAHDRVVRDTVKRQLVEGTAEAG